MEVENRTDKTVWLGLYSLTDTLYAATTFPWGSRKRLNPHAQGTFSPHGQRQQIVFWNQAALGTMLASPKSVFTSGAATIAHDQHGFFVYNHLGDAVPMDKINQFVVLMLENRSFDNLLGWLYERTSNQPPLNIPQPAGKPYYLGLSQGGYWNTREADRHDTAPAAERIYVRHGASSNDKPNPNPSEVCPSFVEQMFGTETPATEQQPNMWGFVQNYAKVRVNAFNPKWTCAPPLDRPNPDVAGIMDCYTPDQVPVLSQLATSYAVCDRWFGSVPCETFPNRSFVHAGTSFGRLNMCDQKYDDCCVPNVFVYAGKRTIFDVLDELGVRWGLYQEAAVLGTLVSIQFWTIAQKLRRAADHLEALPKDLISSRPPEYIFIEPGYVVEGSDQHPPSTLTRGEALIKRVYEIVSQSPTWYRTLLIITYDEHGGCYDHVSPPHAPRPDNAAPQFEVGKLDPFTIYGPRVPAVVVSPFIKPGTVFRGTPGSDYDHTSILASLRDWIFRDGRDLLGNNERIRKAPVVWPVLTLGSARTDRPLGVAVGQAAPFISQAPTDHGLTILAMAEAQRELVAEATSGSDSPSGDWQTRFHQLAQTRRDELMTSARSGVFPEGIAVADPPSAADQ